MRVLAKLLLVLALTLVGLFALPGLAGAQTLTQLVPLLQTPCGFPGSAEDLNFQTNTAQIYCQNAGPASGQISVTRAGAVGMVQNLAGLWSGPFPANTPRESDKGLLVEEARTNSIRNNSNTGASAPSTLPTNWSKASAAGLTITYAYGTENGLPYFEVAASGTTGDTTGLALSFDAPTAIAAVNGQTWTNSATISLTGGSIANISSIIWQLSERDGGGALLAAISSSDFKGSLTATPTPFSSALTITNASTAFQIPKFLVNIGSGMVINFTLRIAALQSELGAFATSPILTTTVAVTRNADVVQVIGAGATIIPLSASAFFQTFGVEGIGSGPRLLDLQTPALQNNGTTTVLASDGTNVTQATLGSGTSVGTVKSAFGLDNTSMTAIANGGTKTTQATSTWTTGAAGKTPYLGNRSDGTRALNGYLQRASFAIPKGLFDNRTSP